MKKIILSCIIALTLSTTANSWELKSQPDPMGGGDIVILEVRSENKNEILFYTCFVGGSGVRIFFGSEYKLSDQEIRGIDHSLFEYRVGERESRRIYSTREGVAGQNYARLVSKSSLFSEDLVVEMIDEMRLGNTLTIKYFPLEELHELAVFDITGFTKKTTLLLEACGI